MNGLMKIDATQYGLVRTEAKQVETAFVPMAKKLSELESEYNTIVTQKKITDELARSARNLRLIYVKIRTSTDEVHAKGKNKLLIHTRAWDGLRNLVKHASSDKESNLMNIEKHVEIQEQKRVEALQNKREQELRKYDQQVVPESLGIMNDAVWDNYLAGVKANYETRKEAEQKAEEEKKEAERIQKLFEEREQILMPFYQWWESKMNVSNFGHLKESEFNDILESLKQKKSNWEAEQKRIKEKNIRLEKEAKARESQEKIILEKHEAALKKEREAKEKLENEIRVKTKEEQAKKDTEAARIEAELNKGDTAKVQDLVDDLDALKAKYTFKSAKNTKMYADVNFLLDKVINHIHKL